MVATTITITYLTKPTELHCQYPGQTSPQPCSLDLSLEDGSLSLGYTGEVGPPYGMTPAEFHHRTLSWGIACLTMDDGNLLLDQAAPIAQRVIAGSEIYWDGNNHVGRQITRDAIAACDEMEEVCASFADGETITTGDVGAWYTDGAESALSWHDLDADSTDEQLAAVGAEVEAEALGMLTVIDADDVVEYLTEARETPRAALREELEEVSESIGRLVGRRNALIAQQIGWGDSSRDVGERAGLSHTRVLAIARDLGEVS